MNDYLNEIFGIEDKVAVVTGGGGHLCSAMAEAFGKARARVAVLDLREEKALTVSRRIKEEGGTSIHFALDVTKKEAHAEAFEYIMAEYGDVDILVNGAGINAPTPFFDIELENWENVIASHTSGTFLACQVFGRHMVDAKKGSIINISSASAGPPLSKAFAYSVAKAGIKNLTQNLAREWALHNVRVNALRPGFFPTEWNIKNFITKEREQAILGHTPMNRYGTPDELVGAILWLASDASKFVTGAEIAVDGGFSAMTI